jgi:hypothetical protein
MPKLNCLKHLIKTCHQKTYFLLDLPTGKTQPAMAQVRNIYFTILSLGRGRNTISNATPKPS